MTIKSQVVLSQNITLVYKSLDLQGADRDVLRGLMAGRSEPMVMDTPTMIVAAYPPTPLVVQVADERVRITLQGESEQIGQIPLWEIAVDASQLIPEGSTLISYGFNYTLGLILDDGDAHALMIDVFLGSAKTVEQALGASLWSFAPRIRFEREQARYELILDPLLDKERIKVLFNVHLEREGITLPATEELEHMYRSEFEYLSSVLPRLLGGQ